MKKKFAAFVLCVICLLSVAGCGQTKEDTTTPPAADQSMAADDYLTTIGGTYVELFPELSKAEYRTISPFPIEKLIPLTASKVEFPSGKRIDRFFISTNGSIFSPPYCCIERSPSLTILNPRIIRMIVTPGPIAYHGALNRYDCAS